MVSESAPNRDVLVVSSGRYACCAQDPADAYTGFSAIEGWAAGRRGTVTENQGVALAAADENYLDGKLAGWLRPGVSLDGAPELFAFVNPERFAFDTQAASSATSNTIRVGSSEYPATLPAGASAGFEVLVLGPGLEPELGTPVAFGTNSSSPGAGQAQEEAMTALLNQAEPMRTVIVQSIGNPKPASGAAGALGLAMARMGASPWTFYSLDGSGDYAFVGNGFESAAAARRPRNAPRGNQRTAGSQRRRTGQRRRLPARPAHPQLRIRSLPASATRSGRRTTNSSRSPTSRASPGRRPKPPARSPPPGTWPKRSASSRGRAPATNRNSPTSAPPTATARSTSTRPRTSWKGRSTRPMKTSPSPRRSSKPCRTSSGPSSTYVADVREMVSALQVPLGGQSPAVDSQAIAGEVLDALPQGSGSGNATAANLSLASAVLYAGEYIPEVGEVLGPIAAVLGLAGELAQENGEYSPDWRIQASADEIGGKVKNRLAAMSAGLGTIEEILVTDWGKLSTAAAAAAGTWGITARGIQRQTSTIELGINQWMWRAILPAAFELVSFPGAPLGSQNQLDLHHQHRADRMAPLGKNVPSESVFFPLVGFESGQPVTSGAFGMLDGEVLEEVRDPGQLEPGREDLRLPRTGRRGLTQPKLFEDSNWTIAQPHMIEEESPRKPGYCGF